jgi:hypothetical protein
LLVVFIASGFLLGNVVPITAVLQLNFQWGFVVAYLRFCADALGFTINAQWVFGPELLRMFAPFVGVVKWVSGSGGNAALFGYRGAGYAFCPCAGVAFWLFHASGIKTIITNTNPHTTAATHPTNNKNKPFRGFKK